ncbi:ribosomal protein S18-alanine N-acetyltransferase [Dasania marina]|uniref:ribosomal protein S18-alanine N-acetyltransferase n=1 Tax=Dasania marina TaxID=471499 RepID=UPI0030DC5CEF
MAAFSASAISTIVSTVALATRPMLLADAASVATLNKSATPYPWSESHFIESINSHDCQLLMDNDRLVGFIVLQHSCGESCLLNMAIHPDYHQSGYAHYLLGYGLQRCVREQSSQCYLEVRTSNSPAIALYTKLSFSEAGQRKNYYPTAQGYEHALIMIKALTCSAGEKI